MISTIELIQQRILHYEELNELKAINDLDVIQEFEKFLSAFSNEKNAMKRKIANLTASSDNLSDDIIEINDNDKKIKFSKTKNDVEMMKNEYEKKNENEKKDEKKKKNAKKNENHEIITISDQLD